MLKPLLARLLRCEKGISALEYGFLCCLIVVVMVVALKGFSSQVQLTWTNISTQVQQASQAAAS